MVYQNILWFILQRVKNRLPRHDVHTNENYSKIISIKVNQPRKKLALDDLCISLQKSDPQMQDGDNPFADYRKTVFDPEWLYYTVCGFCRSVCVKDRAQRQENRKLIHDSGTAALAPDGRHIKAGEDSIRVPTSFGVQVVINPSDFKVKGLQLLSLLNLNY